MKRRQLLGLISLIALGAMIGLVVASDPDLSADGKQSPQTHSHPSDDSDLQPGSSEDPDDPGVSNAGPGTRSGTSPAPMPTVIPEDFIFGRHADYGPDDPTPVGCSMKPNEECLVRFSGNYRLVSLESAIVRFGAYEGESPEPVVYRDINVSKGRGRVAHVLNYVPSSKAETVLFRFTMLTLDGKVLHAPPPSPKIPIHVGPGTRP